MVTSVPAPSTAIDPPSSTIGDVVHGKAEVRGDPPPDRRVGVPGRPLLAPGVEPEVQRVAACRRGATTTIGPVSRIHESSIGSATISTRSSTAAPDVVDVAGRRHERDRLERGDHVRDLGVDVARAVEAGVAPETISAIATVGHAISVRSWRSVSAGMRVPGGGDTREPAGSDMRAS